MAQPRLRQYPKSAITIANGDIYPIERPGSFIRVRSADQTFTLRIDDAEELKAEQNDVFRFREARFGKIEVVNDSGSSLTFQLEVGDGSVETNNVSISGTLKTDDDDTQSLLTTIDGVLDTIKTDTANIADIEALLQNDEDQRAGLTTLEGATYYSASNATTTIATAVANTNGVIVRFAHSMGETLQNQYAGLFVDGNPVTMNASGGGSTSESHMVNDKDIYVPSGVKVELISNLANFECHAWAEVL